MSSSTNNVPIPLREVKEPEAQPKQFEPYESVKYWKTALNMTRDVLLAPILCVIEMLMIFAILLCDFENFSKHVGGIISFASIVSGYLAFLYASPTYLLLLKKYNRWLNATVLFTANIVLGAALYFGELNLFKFFTGKEDVSVLVVFRIELVFLLSTLRGWYDMTFKATPIQNIITWYVISWLCTIPFCTNVLLHNSFTDTAMMNSYLSVAGLIAAAVFAGITKLGSLSVLQFNKITFASKTTLLTILTVGYWLVGIAFTLVVEPTASKASILSNGWTNSCCLWIPELICGRYITAIFKTKLQKEKYVSFAVVTICLIIVQYWALWALWHFVTHKYVVQWLLRQPDNGILARNDHWMAFASGNTMLLWNDMLVFSKGVTERKKSLVKYPVESLLENEYDNGKEFEE